MTFCEKLNQIISILEVSSAELSRAAGLDSSLLSRFRTGERVPQAGSNQFNKLLEGIHILATEKGRESELLGLIQPEGSPIQMQKETLAVWLSPKEPLCVPIRQQIHPSTVTREQFRYRFSMVMDLLDISNIRLAKFLNVDASLISRYRNGLRIPAYNGEIAHKICTYFVNRATTQQKTRALYEVIAAPFDMDFYKILYSYLYSDNENSKYETIDTFLDHLDTLFINTNLSLSPFQAINTPDIACDEAGFYVGTTGFRKAVKRFLCNIIEQPSPQELLLYSDQSMDWLSHDSEFTKTWSALMVILLNKKNRIKIIHHFNRNADEMFVGITSWIPLYISGLIEPYYCKKNEESHFCHTLFICKNIGAITANFVKGAYDSSVYHYTVEKELLNEYALQYDALLQKCAPLIVVYTKNDITAYRNHLCDIMGKSGEMTFLLRAPSIMTMPNELLHKILERNLISENKINEITTYHKNLSEGFYRALNTTRITELITIPSQEAIAAGKQPLNLNGFFLESPIYYTAEEFNLHMSYIKGLSALNYHFLPLPESPFHNIEIISKHSDSILISKNDTPPVAFGLKHPQLRESLEQYLNQEQNGCFQFL